jgi:hypothetical protein
MYNEVISMQRLKLWIKNLCHCDVVEGLFALSKYIYKYGIPSQMGSGIVRVMRV